MSALTASRRVATAAACAALVLLCCTFPLPQNRASGAVTPSSITIVIPRDAMHAGFPSTTYRMRVGSILKVTNRDTVRHSITSQAQDSHGAALFDTTVAPGKTVTVARANTLRANNYGFYCKYHPTMRAVLSVAGSGGTSGSGNVTFGQPLTFPVQLTAADPTVVIERGSQQVMPTGPRTTVIGYDGTYPGPTIRRPAGADTKVTFVNRVGGSYSVHLHGDHHASADDGQPTSYLIGNGQQRTYDYPLTDGGQPEPPSFGYYHDHVMGWTGHNNWDGMQGMFIVDDGREASLGLPTGYWDRPLLISDRSLTSTNQLTAVGRGTDGVPATGATAPPGDATIGNRVLVNGRYRPYMDVYGHQYRLRLLNASNYQTYDFELTGGKNFLQVGTGSSLLPRPVLRHDILLGPAQRADVVVDFSGLAGKQVVLWSVARHDGSKTGIGSPTVPIMQFRVVREATDSTHVAATLEATPPISNVPSRPTYTWNFGMAGNTTTGTYWTINGRTYDPNRIDAVVPLGSTQLWRLTNTSTMTHYVHLHEEQWHTIARDGKPPPAYELGLQDTWRLDPGEWVDVAAEFTDYTGVFMIHCHMLDHEDDGMMAQFEVVDAARTASFRAPLSGAAVSHGMQAMGAMRAAGPAPADPAAADPAADGPASTGDPLRDAALAAVVVLAAGAFGGLALRRAGRRPRRRYRVS